MTGRPGAGGRIVTTLVGLALQMPPTAYVAVTGEAPAWIRIWLAASVAVTLATYLLAGITKIATDGDGS